MRGFVNFPCYVSPKSFFLKGFIMQEVNFRDRLTQAGVSLKANSKGLATGAFIGMTVLATNASAAGLTANAIDTTDFMTVAGVVLTASGVMWGIKKAIHLVRP